MKGRCEMTWLMANIGTIVVAVILAIIVTAVIAKMVKNKKQGKSSCGCGCESCAMKGECHK